MNFDTESKSKDKSFLFFFFGGGGGRGGEGKRVQRRVKLSSGHVDTDRMLIHENNPNQFLLLLHCRLMSTVNI